MNMKTLKKFVDRIGEISVIPEPENVQKMEWYLQTHASTGKITLPNIFETTEL